VEKIFATLGIFTDFRGCQSYRRKGVADFLLANKIFGRALPSPVTFAQTRKFPLYSHD